MIAPCARGKGREGSLDTKKDGIKVTNALKRRGVSFSLCYLM